MNELALFAGAGGGILGGILLGWKTVCAVEFDPYRIASLIQRQNDKILPPFPIWDDIRTFDGKPWSGIVDVISGGFPCQDISAAGKGAGIDGIKSGLWKEMFRIIREVRPLYALVENSPLLTKRGIKRVLGDLASMGYSGKWGVLGADDTGAPHIRKRIWILAYSRCETGKGTTFNSWEEIPLSESGRDGSEKSLAYADSFGESQSKGIFKEVRERAFDSCQNVSNSASSVSEGIRSQQNGEQGRSSNIGWWEAEPEVGRVVDGMAHRLDQLRALGDGQVPAVVRIAWEYLK